jgi:amino acid transporter
MTIIFYLILIAWCLFAWKKFNLKAYLHLSSLFVVLALISTIVYYSNVFLGYNLYSNESASNAILVFRTAIAVLLVYIGYRTVMHEKY